MLPIVLLRVCAAPKNGLRLSPFEVTYGRLFLTDILPDEDVNQSLRDIINLGTPFPNNTRDDSAHGHHQMVNTKIR